MTWIEVTAGILRALAIVVLYVFIGFGPGFVLGLVAANTIWARGKPTVKDQYDEKIQLAAEHNAQWDPEHERWK